MFVKNYGLSEMLKKLLDMATVILNKLNKLYFLKKKKQLSYTLYLTYRPFPPRRQFLTRDILKKRFSMTNDEP